MVLNMQGMGRLYVHRLDKSHKQWWCHTSIQMIPAAIPMTITARSLIQFSIPVRHGWKNNDRTPLNTNDYKRVAFPID